MAEASPDSASDAVSHDSDLTLETAASFPVSENEACCAARILGEPNWTSDPVSEYSPDAVASVDCRDNPASWPVSDTVETPASIALLTIVAALLPDNDRDPCDATSVRPIGTDTD